MDDCDSSRATRIAWLSIKDPVAKDPSAGSMMVTHYSPGKARQLDSWPPVALSLSSLSSLSSHEYSDPAVPL